MVDIFNKLEAIRAENPVAKKEFVKLLGISYESYMRLKDVDHMSELTMMKLNKFLREHSNKETGK